MKPAVVSIVAYDPAKALPGTGTGWLIGPDRMVTCRHVLGGCDRAEIRLADGRYAKIVGLLAEERNWDLALCALDRSFIDVTPLATTAALPAEGETVLLIGGPLGLEWTSSVGIISALRELPTLGTVLQHTAAISPGNSGGPVFNVQGQVVGMQTSTITTDNKVVAAGQGLNFAVPASYIQALRAGPMRSLADCAKEVPGDWRASSTALLDKCSLRPFSRGDFEGALGYFEESTRRDPDVADVWLRMAICHEKLGNLDRAGECYLRATKIDPTLAIAFNNLGVVSFRQKRTDEAIGYLNKALSLKPDMALAYSNLADCFNSLGRYDDALAACQKGLSFDGRHANLRYALGITYLNLGHKSLAGEQARLLDTLDKAQADRLRQEIAKNGT
ncbi:MAG: tetratricopeptide repeat protein [Armatimonadetes bacterium]|nr:tetratricopeptide repeat protein [Armatimonadota bacterium]